MTAQKENKDKDIVGGENTTTPTAGKGNTGTKPAGGRKVEVDADKLEKILLDNETFKRQIGELQSNAVTTSPNPNQIRNKKKETFLKLRKWNDSIVVGWENVGKENKPVYVYSEYNAQTRENIQFINLILKDGKKPEKVEYLTYLRDSEPVFAKMLKKVAEEDEVITQGMVYKRDFVENGYGMFETTVQVPVEVTIAHNSYVVLLEDGEELTISDRFLG